MLLISVIIPCYNRANVISKAIESVINQTVKECIEEIRTNSDSLKKLFTVYVTDDKNVLLGRVSLRKLLISKDNVVISDIYIDKIFSVKTTIPFLRESSLQ